jgi:hypothetical protein
MEKMSRWSIFYEREADALAAIKQVRVVGANAKLVKHQLS